MRRWRPALVCALLALAVGHPAQAGSFSAVPVRIALTPVARTASLTIENHGEEEVLVQSQMMAWSQRDGSDVLEESRELLVSPPIFRIPARGAQTLRVGLMRNADPSRQLTYRLFLQETPPPPKAGQQGVTVALRLSLPVFVAPVAPIAPQFRWEARPAAGGSLALTLLNSGNAHVQLVDFKLFLPDGALLAEQQVVAYVLAGQSRSWVLKPTRAWDGEKLKLTAKTDAGEISAEIAAASR